MTEAKFALTNTESPLAEISWRVGYENVDHFAKLFMRHVGCSPNDYRKQFKIVWLRRRICCQIPDGEIYLIYSA